jgi:hypothetical protein
MMNHGVAAVTRVDLLCALFCGHAVRVRLSCTRNKMPSRDFRGILKMSLFHCSYFIKQLPNGFPSRIAWSMHLGCCSTSVGKRKNTLACSSSLATSLVRGSRNPARKTIRYSFNLVPRSEHMIWVNDGSGDRDWRAVLKTEQTNAGLYAGVMPSRFRSLLCATSCVIISCQPKM